MPSDVHSASPDASYPVSEIPSRRGQSDEADAELSIGTAAFRFVAMLVVTLASAVAMSGFEPMQLATVVGLL
ncbi:hypothetical protein [Xylophilus sp. Leaf220]|uniref:hypothetical protein n=1 Tax=Xylophilus sp. Leaf220 TaxID=1735686 RepID=UPI0012E21298|nr:hypothetical protein [Xylophilus sp. Leaf220]